MQKSKLINSLAAVALLAGTMSVSFAAGPQDKPAAPGGAEAQSQGQAPAAATDDSITATAKSAVSADAKLAGLPINIATAKGVVTVSGEVPDAASGERVLQIVASVSGVKDIKNTLKVKGAG
ncbi:hyperosmotically inducible protein [Actimicrobium sp. GrIS 1.19]|uniref:BON domain-containing protein n=1 Tax=Actimicrobium sp. GrIS 1.19 TaxID=3071708 RepID=UPI002DFD3B35|nr:hyperosmotically inducible protein [Actimicrobium sp. GrIS 1.19]